MSTTKPLCPFCRHEVDPRADGTCPDCQQAVFPARKPEVSTGNPLPEDDPPNDSLDFLASEEHPLTVAKWAGKMAGEGGIYALLRPAAGNTTPTPVRRRDSLKLILAGLTCLVALVGEVLIGHIELHLTVALLLLGPPILFFGLVGLAMPRRLVGSKVHEILNKAGVIVMLLAIIAGCALWILACFR